MFCKEFNSEYHL